MGCNDNFEPNEEECQGCINWKYGMCLYEEPDKYNTSIPNVDEMIFQIGHKKYTRDELVKLLQEDNWKELLKGE